MRHSIEYKQPKYRSTIGYMKLDKCSYSLELKILKCCNRHSPKLTILYNDILKSIKKHFKVVDTNYNIKKTNMVQLSRVERSRRLQK